MNETPLSLPSFVIQLFVLVSIGIGGIWAMWTFFGRKIERTYSRIDEKDKQYYKDFVTKEIHELTMKYQEEKLDTKIDGELKLVRMALNNMNDKLDTILKKGG